MDAALLQRFRDALDRLTDGDGRCLGLAVSGGPDSLALLLLAHEALGDGVAAATVDHQLRPESADEARHVAAICDELGVAHAILTPSEPITGNLQAGAREARYALLEDWRVSEGLGWVATAHHADDQLETMLMRLLRGSGVSGLAAIRPVNGRVIRPLLGFRKAELEAVVAQSRFEPVDDPSNRDNRFDRVRLRQVLAEMPDFDPARLARSGAALAEAEEALDWATEKAAADAIREVDGHIEFDPEDLPAEFRRRLALACIGKIAPDAESRGPAVDDLLAALEKGEKRTLGGVLCEGGPVWVFSPAPPRKTG